MSEPTAAAPNAQAWITAEDKSLPTETPWDNPKLAILNANSKSGWRPMLNTEYVWLLMSPDELRVANKMQVTLPFQALKGGGKRAQTKDGLYAITGGHLVHRPHQGGWLLFPDPSLAGPPQTGRSPKPNAWLVLAQGLFKNLANLTVVLAGL
jgi:hypothetical protein